MSYEIFLAIKNTRTHLRSIKPANTKRAQMRINIAASLNKERKIILLRKGESSFQLDDHFFVLDARPLDFHVVPFLRTLQVCCEKELSYTTWLTNCRWVVSPCFILSREAPVFAK